MTPYQIHLFKYFTRKCIYINLHNSAERGQLKYLNTRFPSSLCSYPTICGIQREAKKTEYFVNGVSVYIAIFNLKKKQLPLFIKQEIIY